MRWFLALLCALLVATGCSRKASPAKEGAVALPEVTDTSMSLLLTWVDERGEFHVEQRVADVPESARDVVRVRALDADGDPPESSVFLVDLRVKGDNGKYAVRAAPRSEFERLAEERRQKHGAVLADKPAAAGSGAASGAQAAAEPAVIIYGASWCGPCHQAKAYLKQRGVAFVEKDIEEDSAAAREMQAKLAKVGKHGGSIPVLDVRGRILIGFDPGSVDRALAASR